MSWCLFPQRCVALPVLELPLPFPPQFLKSISFSLPPPDSNWLLVGSPTGRLFRRAMKSTFLSEDTPLALNSSGEVTDSSGLTNLQSFALSQCTATEWDMSLPACALDIAFATWIVLNGSKDFTHTFQLTKTRDIVVLPYLAPPFSVDVETLRERASLVVVPQPGDGLQRVLTLFDQISHRISGSTAADSCLRGLPLHVGVLGCEHRVPNREPRLLC